MFTKILSLATLSLFVSQASFAHSCDADAKVRAERLIKFHYLDGQAGTVENVDVPSNIAVKSLKPIKALVGKGKLDVLEVTGYVYKAEYRVRMIYAQFPGCVLMGQEILENSNPY